MMSWAIQNIDVLTHTASHVSSIATHSIGSDLIGTHSIASLVPHDGHIVLAQQFQQDILGDLTKAFGKFVKSGQLAAMGVGFLIGFIFKSITSYG
jgi:hypothetical protein